MHDKNHPGQTGSLFIFNLKFSNMEPDKFVPRGAIAFFFILLALAAIIWFSIYFLMLSRA